MNLGNLLGLEPVEGGDKRLQSLNYMDASKANLYQAGEAEEKDKEDTNCMAINATYVEFFCKIKQKKRIFDIDAFNEAWVNVCG